MDWIWSGGCNRRIKLGRFTEFFNVVASLFSVPTQKFKIVRVIPLHLRNRPLCRPKVRTPSTFVFIHGLNERISLGSPLRAREEQILHAERPTNELFAAHLSVQYSNIPVRPTVIKWSRQEDEVMHDSECKNKKEEGGGELR